MAGARIKRIQSPTKRRRAAQHCFSVATPPLARSLFQEFQEAAAAEDQDIEKKQDSNICADAESCHDVLVELKKMCKEENERRRKEFLSRFGFDLKEERPVQNPLWTWSRV